MKTQRSELFPGVWLTAIQQESATACLSVSLLTQLEQEHAATNALLPRILCHGTARAATPEALAALLKGTGGMKVEPLTRCVGEIECIGLRAEYTPALKGTRDSLLPDAVALLCEVLLNPATRGGLLLPATVEAERDAMEAEQDEDLPAAEAALNRCLQEMCCYEDYSAKLPGASRLDDCSYKKLTKYYHTLLQTCPMEFVYCGPVDGSAVKNAFRDALSAMPRAEVEYDIGTDIRMNAVEDQVRKESEPAEVDAPLTVLGYRLGELAEDDEAVASVVLPELLKELLKGTGEGVDVFCDRHKGLLAVTLPLDQPEAAAAFEAVLESLKAGTPDQAVLETVKNRLCAQLATVSVTPAECENFTLARMIGGPDCDPDEMAELVRFTTLKNIGELCETLDADLFYTAVPYSK